MSAWYDQHAADISAVCLAYEVGELTEQQAIDKLCYLGFSEDDAFAELADLGDWEWAAQ